MAPILQGPSQGPPMDSRWGKAQPAHAASGWLTLTHRKVHEWRLVFGAQEIEYGTNKPVKPPLQERYVEKIIIHDHFDYLGEGNDIALLKITPPVACGPFIGPACLPPAKAVSMKPPQICYVAGWGFVKEDGECGRGCLGGHCCGSSWDLGGACLSCPRSHDWCLLLLLWGRLS